MKVRMNHYEVNPKVYETMLGLEKLIASSGLDHTLYELIKIRASQMNGCAFCLDMHTQALLKAGGNEHRIHLISVWRESPFFTEAERAALELTEAVTLISDGGVPQSLYERVREHFDEKQYVTLIMAIVTINGWNRLAISTGMFPGCLDPQSAE
ncbi:carboxymuconolactone decarboxylase family protein [Paenibacillus sp. MZ04-78.2]|uniref:carboxymuconolactone decarboxylase family protein n=1 Tax=Paenibacillus sp. MZ04-78.2 TaxID=2962034 RepID=UPI0020B786F5|nr:carboxymuconolactone decarboxylase family protein [Paenibacillus sp. MZ04-78.2]MCP3773686.1 carboxymuconolactone decarboxylase family protein [Paenibacillus sp. MZ04-78.2]